MTQAGPSIVITYPHSLGTAGGGTVGCLEISRHLAKEGVRLVVVPVVTLTRDNQLFRKPNVPEEFQGHEQEAELRDHGIEVVRVQPHNTHWLLDGLPTLKAVKSIMAHQRVDAVFGWHQEFSFVPRAVRRKGIFTGQFVSGDYSWAGKGLKPHATWTEQKRKAMARASRSLKGKVHWWIQRRMLIESLAKSDVVFAISEYTRDLVAELCEIPVDRFTIAHWGVNEVFTKVSRARPDAITNFVFYGSSSRRKGGFETLRAFGELKAKGHENFNIRLIWQHHDEMEAIAREAGIRDKVEFLDPTDHHGLARHLEWSHLALFPSAFESFGLACAESQASGVPVIAYDVGGVKEIVRHGETGWLVPCEREDLLQGPITEAMADPQRTYEMGLAGREFVQAAYTWEATAKTILARLEAGLRNGNP